MAPIDKSYTTYCWSAIVYSSICYRFQAIMLTNIVTLKATSGSLKVIDTASRGKKNTCTLSTCRKSCAGALAELKTPYRLT